VDNFDTTAGSPIPLLGKISHINRESGFGTITTPDGEEYLFQATQVKGTGLIGIPQDAGVEFFLSEDKVQSVSLLVFKNATDELLEGTLTECKPERGFGFVRTQDGARFFVHISSFFPRKNVLPRDGEAVVFEVANTDKGLEAVKVQLVKDLKSTKGQHLASREFLNAALICRSERDTKGARDIYERGIKTAPSPELISSYAAMERGRNDASRALEILQRGIQIFDKNAKFHADAAHIALQLKNLPLAIRLAEDGIGKAHQQPGIRAELLELVGMAYYESGDYRRAEKSWADIRKQRRSAGLDRRYLRAWIEIHCPIAKNALSFLSACGFALRDMRTLHQTVYIDFLFDLHQEAFSASYGLEGTIFVRCFVKQDPTQADIEDAIKAMRGAAKQTNICPEAMLVVLHSSAGLSRYLGQLADTANQRPICVVLDAGDVEAARPKSLAQLRTRLDEWLYRRNLYNDRFPVTGSSFFGRNQTLKECEGQLNTGNHIGIFGLRKTGKTSLLFSLRDRLINDVVVYLDLQQFGRGAPLADVSRRLIEETNRQVAEKFQGIPHLPKPKTVGSAMAEIVGLMDVVRSRQKAARFVLLVDEVERMAPGGDGSASGFEFFSSLRGTAQQARSILSIICGADPTINLVGQWDKGDNPIFQFYHPLYLPPLDKSECHEMVTRLGRGMGAFYDQAALDAIFVETFGHPAIARGLCSKITQERKERPLQVDASMVDSVANEYSFVEAELLKEILERFSSKPTERALLEIILEAGGSIDESHLLSIVKGGEWDSLRRLLNYSVLVKHESRYTISMGLLARCLKREGL
jgi:cold shock CspA family protein